MWLKYVREKNAEPAHEDHYLFPAISPTGQMYLGRQVDAHVYSTQFAKVMVDCGLSDKHLEGKFTTHCCRRGGAQYRYSFAKQRWSLNAIKWWGGWGKDESNVSISSLFPLDE